MTSYHIDGHWRGHYTYERAPDSGSAFDATFSDDKDGLSGEIVDDASLGAAVLSGSFSYPSVQFTKVYIGKRRGLNPIDYRGTMSDDGKTMRGKWVIQTGDLYVKGSWTAHRIDQMRPKEQQKTGTVSGKLEEVF